MAKKAVKKAVKKVVKAGKQTARNMGGLAPVRLLGKGYKSV
tara:strand:- start:3243 stop:3365 length:123 start_codon:yes stop_codon:yes gene_type:complete